MSVPPQITLLIPCYNAGRYLPRLIESVRALTRPFDAILCYDDGSRDDTIAVARQLGLTILEGGANAGVAHARNRLVEAAGTEWIHFHDADDLLRPTFVERLAPSCDERHDVVSCDADWVDETERNLMVPWRYDPEQLARAPLPHLLRHSMGLNNSIIRRSTWQAIGGCDPRLAMWEDADVHIRLARHGARFHHVPEVLTISLRHADSFSHDHRRSWTCRVAALERYAEADDAGQITADLLHEAEQAAAVLALHHDRDTAERALALCRRLGGQPPTTRNPVLKALKPFVPAYWLLRLQTARRHRR